MLAGLALETVRVARIDSRETLEMAVHIHLPGKSSNRTNAVPVLQRTVVTGTAHSADAEVSNADEYPVGKRIERGERGDRSGGQATCAVSVSGLVLRVR